jgi:hypothetical protein
MLIGESSAGPSNTRQSGEGKKFTTNTWSSIHNILNKKYNFKETQFLSSCADDAEQRAAAASRGPAYHRFA